MVGSSAGFGVKLILGSNFLRARIVKESSKNNGAVSAHRKLTYWERQGLPTPGLSYQWNLFRRELGLYDVELRQQLGPTYGAYEGLTPVLVLGDPDLVREVLVRQFPKFPSHRAFAVGVPEVDLNLFELDGRGEAWRRIRGIMSPAFTGAKLRAMSPLLGTCVRTLCGHLGAAADGGKPIPAKTYFYSLTIDVLLRTAYGAEIDTLKDLGNPILEAVNGMFSDRTRVLGVLCLMWPGLARRLGLRDRLLVPFRFLFGMTESLIRQRVLEAGQGLPVPSDFLQLMLDAKGLSDEEIKAQSLVLLVAGFDTTAVALSCAAYFLATHPEAQEELYRELASVQDLEDLSELSVDRSDVIGNLKYLDAFLKEVLRLAPPSIRVERRCEAEHMVGSVLVRPGTIVSIPVYALQRDPKLFSNPDQFEPRRFLAGGPDVNHHPFAYLPFGAGARQCLAQRFAVMTAKCALANLVLKFRVLPTPETKLEFNLASFDNLNPKDIIVLLEKR